MGAKIQKMMDYNAIGVLDWKVQEKEEEETQPDRLCQLNDQPIKSMMDGINDFYYFQVQRMQKCMETHWLIELVHTSPKEREGDKKCTELKWMATVFLSVHYTQLNYKMKWKEEITNQDKDLHAGEWIEERIYSFSIYIYETRKMDGWWNDTFIPLST
jgi:hypothetical protein